MLPANSVVIAYGAELAGCGRHRTEADEIKEYIAELEADIMPIDNLIAFAGSEAGAGYFVPNWQRILPHMLKK